MIIYLLPALHSASNQKMFALEAYLENHKVEEVTQKCNIPWTERDISDVHLQVRRLQESDSGTATNWWAACAAFGVIGTFVTSRVFTGRAPTMETSDSMSAWGLQFPSSKAASIAIATSESSKMYIVCDIVSFDSSWVLKQ